MLNEKGRIQSELTITRLPNNLFYVLSSTASEIRDFDWFNFHINKEQKVNIKKCDTNLWCTSFGRAPVAFSIILN